MMKCNKQKKVGKVSYGEWQKERQTSNGGKISFVAPKLWIVLMNQLKQNRWGYTMEIETEFILHRRQMFAVALTVFHWLFYVLHFSTGY